MHESRRLSRILTAVLAMIAVALTCPVVEAATPEPTVSANAAGTSVTVTGIADVTNVSGVNPINVTITNGSATQVQLLVDDKAESSASSAPFQLAWDTTKESPGIHTVTLRITSATGATIDKKFVVEVVLLTPTVAPTAAPTVSSNSAANRPTATSVASAGNATEGAPGFVAYAAAIAGLVLVVGGIIAALSFLIRRKPATAVTPLAPPPPVTPRVVEHTVVIEPLRAVAPADAEGTMVAGGLADGKTVVGMPKIPRARLQIFQQGVETSVVISQPETVLGREATNPIIVRDPQASRKHARIIIEGGEFWYEDLKSLNGSRINGEVVVGRQKLSANDQITIGEAVLTFTQD